MASDYSEKLKDPRWQKKRLEIFQRDDWQCRVCQDSESMLAVHHKIYLPQTDPWDYPDYLLITLCEDCHEFETVNRLSYERQLIDLLKVDVSINFLKWLCESIGEFDKEHTGISGETSKHNNGGTITLSFSKAKGKT